MGKSLWLNTSSIVALSLLLLQSCNSTVMTKESDFPIILQNDRSECGPVCLQMIGRYNGFSWKLEEIKKYSKYNSTIGTSLLGLADAVDSLGGRSLGVKIDYQGLLQEVPLPALLHWDNSFVVAYKVRSDSIWIADPARGLISYSKSELCDLWYEKTLDSNEGGFALAIEIRNSR